jgi:predicted metal-dependent hydrolase
MPERRPVRHTGRTPAPKPNRPRDPDAPPKPRRPRDELGRPMAWGAEGTLHLEDYDSLPREENHRLGIEHFDAERFFPAHEAWETCWKQSKGTPDAEFFKGLSQLGAGYTHLLRGNLHGAHTLLRRGGGRVGGYGSAHLGVDAAGLARAALADAERIEDAESSAAPAPDLAFPKIR